MSVKVVTPPASPVVLLDDAKKHLRVDHGDDDDTIAGLVAAATTWLDGPAGWLGRSLGVQTLELTQPDFGCGPIWLPFPPAIDITSVKYVAADGTLTTVAADQYELVEDEVRPIYGTSWPSPRCQSDAVRIRYRAGYQNGIPASIAVSIKMLVGQWYETREAVAIGVAVEQMPFAVDQILSPMRVYS